ncbi:hypothetical protein BJ742DRAFT_836118 [Cladochytrium replicatum]|nr:hypothetical protein BJ742DRAFT_836118 [Cladochytrium replicatum]
MSLLTYGFTGSYTNITYPTPQCGFFDWTIDGSSLEFGDYQSRICISNKVVIALTVTNCIASTATWTFGIYLTVREFSMVREWNDTKNFCLFYFVGAVGAALFAVNDIVGSPVWNSVGWYLATIGVCAMVCDMLQYFDNRQPLTITTLNTGGFYSASVGTNYIEDLKPEEACHRHHTKRDDAVAGTNHGWVNILCLHWIASSVCLESFMV